MIDCPFSFPRLWIRFLVVLMLKLSAVSAYAQLWDYSIQDIKTFPIHSFHPENSEGPVIVLYLEQDADGYIWAGTDTGLFRFDGNRFVQFAHDPLDESTIDDDFVSTVYSDSQGRLWVGTAKGLQLYRTETEGFQRIPIYGERVPEFRRFLVRRIVEDQSGLLYLATQGNGVRVVGDDMEVTPLSRIAENPIEGMDDWRVNRVYIDADDRLWISTIENGLFRYFPESKRLERGSELGSLQSALAGHEVRAILDSRDGNLWFGTHGQGIVKWNETEDFSVNYGPSKGSDRPFASESIRNITMDTHGNIWVGTQDIGLFILDPEQDAFEAVSHSGSAITRMGEGAVTSLLVDSRGDIWFSTLYSGAFAVFHINMNPAGFRYALMENEDGKNLAKNPVLYSYEDSKGNLWVGTDGDGLMKKDAVTESLTMFKYDSQDSQSLSNDKVTSIIEDRFGGIWIGTRSGGLNRLDAQTDKFTRIPIGDTPGSVRGRAVWSLCVDGDFLWIGTEVGISLYDTRRNLALDPKLLFGPSFNMPKRAVWSMAIDAEGHLWIASLSGLYVGSYNLGFGSAEVDGLFERISRHRSQSVEFGRNQEMYVATLENGLFKMTEEHILERPFSEGMNFESNVLHSVDLDLKGNLWVTTRAGFVKIDAESGERTSFDSRWGFEAQYYWVHNALVGSNGWVYFPSRKGLLFFDPDRIGFATESLVPLITTVEGMIENRGIPGETIRYDHVSDESDGISLKHSESVLRFHYSALFYPQPHSVEYQTFLVGFDSDWSPVTHDTSVSYPLLSPGNYEFQVRSRIVGQDWGEASRAVAINVLPPFYFRWWFIGLSVLFVASVVYLILQLRVRKMNAQTIVLEGTVSQRTLELQERNAEILKQRDELEYHRNHLEDLIGERTAELESAKEKAEESSRLKTAFLANMSHEIRTPLNSIVNFSQLLFDSNLENEDREKFKDIVENSSRALLRLIEDVLDIARLEAGELRIEMKPCDIVTMLDRLCETYQGKLKVNDLDLELKVEYPDGFEEEVETDVIRLNQVMVNLLDNAVKFTEEGSVRFGFEIKGDNLEFFVVDTGIGIAEENIERIFERFSKIEEDRRKVFPGAGLGLAISRRLVGLLGGELRAESIEGQGSTFTFTIPFKVTEESEAIATNGREEAKTFDWKDHTILVVEDEYSNVEVLKAFLRPTSANVLYAEDGDEAVTCLKADSSIDLVLMDLKLPVMDGVTATQAIREFNQQVPIIAQTAYGVSHERIETLKCGFNDYVTKPIDRDRLLSSIDHHLRQS